jgi:hypothetical protein
MSTSVRYANIASGAVFRVDGQQQVAAQAAWWTVELFAGGQR